MARHNAAAGKDMRALRGEKPITTIAPARVRKTVSHNRGWADQTGRMRTPARLSRKPRTTRRGVSKALIVGPSSGEGTGARLIRLSYQ